MNPAPGSKQSTILDFFKESAGTATTSSSLLDLRQNKSTINLSLSTGDLTVKQKVCTNKKCPFCPILDKSGQITCSVTGKTHISRYNVSCKSSNLIYCITCKCCSKQYVGQTKNTLAKRFYSHFHNVRHNKTTDGVGLHFSRADHKGTSDFQLHILEFIRLPPQSERARALRLLREKSWIHKMRCPAPRGLNIFD